MLGLSAIVLLAATFTVEQVTEKMLTGAPEITQAMKEEEEHSEEE